MNSAIAPTHKHSHHGCCWASFRTLLVLSCTAAKLGLDETGPVQADQHQTEQRRQLCDASALALNLWSMVARLAHHAGFRSTTSQAHNSSQPLAVSNRSSFDERPPAATAIEKNTAPSKLAWPYACPHHAQHQLRMICRCEDLHAAKNRPRSMRRCLSQQRHVLT